MFVNRILLLINERGITKNKLLTDLELNKNSFVNWNERGSIPSSEAIKRIAEYFNVTTDYLLGNTDIKKELPPEDVERIQIFANKLLNSGALPDLSNESIQSLMDFIDASGSLLKHFRDKE